MSQSRNCRLKLGWKNGWVYTLKPENGKVRPVRGDRAPRRCHLDSSAPRWPSFYRLQSTPIWGLPPCPLVSRSLHPLKHPAASAWCIFDGARIILTSFLGGSKAPWSAIPHPWLARLGASWSQVIALGTMVKRYDRRSQWHNGGQTVAIRGRCQSQHCQQPMPCRLLQLQVRSCRLWSTTLVHHSALVHHSVLVLHSGPPLCSGPPLWSTTLF